MKKKLSHYDQAGRAHGDVGQERHVPTAWRMFVKLKAPLGCRTIRRAIRWRWRVAGILAAKKTVDLIPMCHPLPLRMSMLP
jgi:hypothetical protein